VLDLLAAAGWEIRTDGGAQFVGPHFALLVEWDEATSAVIFSGQERTDDEPMVFTLRLYGALERGAVAAIVRMAPALTRESWAQELVAELCTLCPDVLYETQAGELVRLDLAEQ
jgi:hypothetical protein